MSHGQFLEVQSSGKQLETYYRVSNRTLAIQLPFLSGIFEHFIIRTA